MMSSVNSQLWNCASVTTKTDKGMFREQSRYPRIRMNTILQRLHLQRSACDPQLLLTNATIVNVREVSEKKHLQSTEEHNIKIQAIPVSWF